MKTKSALPWFGSDAGVAAQLGAMLDHCKHVTVGFVGGASILPHLKARAIVANDMHGSAINFYRALSSHYGSTVRNRLIRMCRHTLSHPDELVKAADYLSGTVMERAWAFWALCWIGRKGQGGTRHQGGMPSIRRTATGGTNASRIKSAASDLHAWAHEFERCEWECRDFRELLADVADHTECGIYSDPPWVGAGHDYLHTFTEQDHRDLADAHRRFSRTTVLIRYGDDPLIRELYPSGQWTWIAASSRTQANTVRGEVWITNREVSQ